MNTGGQGQRVGWSDGFGILLFSAFCLAFVGAMSMRGEAASQPAELTDPVEAAASVRTDVEPAMAEGSRSSMDQSPIENVSGPQERPSESTSFKDGEKPDHPVTAFVPGTDTSLCMNWEPTIAVSPVDPQIVVASQFLTIQVSFDGGNTFIPSITANVPANFSAGGDPSLAFDSQGNLFLSYLCSPNAGSGRDVCITGWSCTGGSCNQITGPVNVTAAAGHGAPANADKEWMAADYFAGSPYQDRIYIAWVDLSPSPWQIWNTYSDDQGATWSMAQQISQNDESKVWPVHNTVAPNGDYYVAWHSQTGFLDGANQRVPDGTTGQIVFRRSTDGGDNFNARTFPFGAGQADVTWNVQHKANGVIPGAIFWLMGTVQPWVLADPNVAGRVFVVANDDPNNNVDTGDAADVMIAVSNDSGGTWNAPTPVGTSPGNSFQVMPTAAIDPITGSIAVAYYDNRSGVANGGGNFLLDWLGTYSTDGGTTWFPEVDFNDGQFNPDLATTCRFCGNDSTGNLNCTSMGCGGPRTTRIGEYNGVAFGECTAYTVWADAAVPACGGTIDTYFDRDPEMGGDLTEPDITCPANVALGCNDSTDPANTGAATATDQCDVDPSIGFVDMVTPGNCPPGILIQTIARIWNATDAAGNINTCEQTITITDATPPTISAPAPLELECNIAGGVAGDDPAIVAWYDTATGNDECGDVDITHTEPDLFPSDCEPGEETQITFSGSDECGNVGFDTSSVTVVDTTDPEITCPADIFIKCASNPGEIVDWDDPAASDDCDPNPTVTCDPPSGSFFNSGFKEGDGTRLVTCTVEDNCGMTAECNFDVTLIVCGACCNFDGTCTDDVQRNDCLNAKGREWFKDTPCDKIKCNSIPTVSEWGLVVMTLLGCTIGTVVFRRRQRAVA